ncbi:hsp90 co-chaperone Cdc37 [Blyttiomyces sp. JEL0837]|nr:hsp90 co-chaperone Cdc37 [Blyttiomyces sp. JEL0837]
MPQGFSYAKWDKLELSDDEDFDCHPNVDKASMVRWKQAEIHRKRRERQDKIKALRLESDLYKKISESLDKWESQYLQPSTANIDEIRSSSTSLSAQVKEWNEGLEREVYEIAHTDRDYRWAPPTPDPFFMKRLPLQKMADSLIGMVSMVQVNDAGVVDTTILKTWINGTKSEFAKRDDLITHEISKEEAEINAKITSETIKEGFSKTVVSKTKEPEPEPEPAPAPKTKTVKTKETSIITLNDPANSQAAVSAEPQPKPVEEKTAKTQEDEDEDDDDVFIHDPRVEEFSKINDPQQSYQFISRHPFILNSKYSDEILAEAFSLETKGQSKRAKEYVRQSLMIQYCHVLGKDGVMLFFKRLTSPDHQAAKVFYTDVDDTYNRIAKRVMEIAAEKKAKEDEEKRQGEARVAAALQPDGTYKLPVTEESTDEDRHRAEVFDQLPHSFQGALLKQDVDEINAFLGSVEKTEAERFLNLAASVGLITLSDEGDEEEGVEEGVPQ